MPRLRVFVLLIGIFFFLLFLLSNPHERKPLPLQHSDKETVRWRAASQILGPRRREGLTLRWTEEQAMPESPGLESPLMAASSSLLSGARSRRGKCVGEGVVADRWEGHTWCSDSSVWRCPHKTVFRGKDINCARTPMVWKCDSQDCIW
jgi:hypothetical protein